MVCLAAHCGVQGSHLNDVVLIDAKQPLHQSDCIGAGNLWFAVLFIESVKSSGKLLKGLDTIGNYSKSK